MEGLVILLVFIAGISNGIMDELQFHFHKSVFSNKSIMFWNPEMSWMNKYKFKHPKYGPKFFGSTTFLVWITDAWHLFQMIMWTSLFLSIVLYQPILDNFIFDFILLRIVFFIGFKIFYK